MIEVHQLTNGQVIGGDFRIEELLRMGGMGAVYRVTQLSTGKRRALKAMHPEYVADETLRRRFDQEARVASLIDSDHVVDVIASGVIPSGLPWLAMELLDGQDLGEYLAGRGALSLMAVSEILAQLCHALGAAHDAGVIHRDVKPENVFVARSRRATMPAFIKVLDFGIAKVAAQTSVTRTTGLGSPIWMAPEQTDPKASITAAADVWAVGLLTYWLLTGQPYWLAAQDAEASMVALMREILFGPLEPASQRAVRLNAAELPDGFDDWFSRCVSREPTERYANADQLWQGFVAQVDSAARVSLSSLDAIPRGDRASTKPPEVARDRISSIQLPLGEPSRPSVTPAGMAPAGHTEVMVLGAPAGGVSMNDAFAAPASSGSAAAGSMPVQRTVVQSPHLEDNLGEAAGIDRDDSQEDVDSELPLPELSRRQPTWFVVGLVAALAAATLAFWVVRRDPKQLPLNGRSRSEGRAAASARTTPQATSKPSASQRSSATVGEAPAPRPVRRKPGVWPPSRSATAQPSNAPEVIASASASAAASAAPTASSAASNVPREAPLRPFDRAAARAVLRSRARSVRSRCSGERGPRKVRLRVTFGPSGGVTRVVVSSKPGASSFCAQRHFWSLKVAPFDGTPATMAARVRLR